MTDYENHDPVNDKNPLHGNGTGSHSAHSDKRTGEYNGTGPEGNGHLPPTTEDLFLAFIAKHIKSTPNEIIADDELHRYNEDGEENVGKSPLWYVLHLDGPAPWGVCGDWRLGDERFTWRGEKTRDLTPEEKAEHERRRKERNNERLKAQRKAARKAQKIFDEAINCRSFPKPTFPYLARKNVGVYGSVIQTDENEIAIPVCEDGDKITSLQYIYASAARDKSFLYEGKIKGCWFTLAEPRNAPTSPIVIAEGYATGAEIHEGTGYPVIVAFNAGNLEAVAKNVAKKYPGAEIIIAGDDDLKTQQKIGKNTGVEKATEAAAAVGGVAVFPPFDRKKEGIEPSDWNDFAALRGKENVGAIFKEEVEKAKQREPDEGGNIVPPPGEDDVPPSPPGDYPSPDEADKKRHTDFIAFLPAHNYIYIPTREHWPAAGVNACLPPVQIGTKNGKPVFISASAWIDRSFPVDQMAWVPGEPMLISDRLLVSGGWIEKKGAKCFNSYMPPVVESGDASKAGPWIELMRKLYPHDADHIIAYLAFKVQRPQIKINHALVLGGPPGIGKDTLLEPVKHGVGPWNFQEISPTVIGGTFDGYKRCVILRISEAHDLGELSRYEFYEHMKTLSAAPPDVLRVNEKHTKEYYVLNCCGIIITTNYKTDGMYLPAEDRRNLVAWSDMVKEDFTEDFWIKFWHWYLKEGGIAHVVAFLRQYDLSRFDPKKPPPKTAAFWAIVDANRAPEIGELTDLIEAMENPDALTLKQLTNYKSPVFSDNEGDFQAIQEWLRDQKNRRTIPHRLEKCGYTPVRNDTAKDGLWKIGGARQVIYAKHELSIQSRIEAAQTLVKEVADNAAARKKDAERAAEEWRRKQEL